MATDTDTHTATAWQNAERRLSTANRIMENYDTEFWRPAIRRREEFELANGLIGPRHDRDGTPDYHAKRHSLLTANPDFQVPNDIDDIMETLVDAFSAAESALMALPAPDLSALRWKLDHILEPSDGSTDSWDIGYVQPMLDDIARLLPRREA